MSASNSIYYQQLANNARRLISRKLIVAAIKSLLTPFNRSIVWNVFFPAPRLWEKANFYIIIIKNLWTFSTFFPSRFAILERSLRFLSIVRSFVHSFVPVAAEKRKVFAKTRARLSLPIWKGERRNASKRLLIRAHGTEHKAFPRKKKKKRKESFCVGKRIIIP